MDPRIIEAMPETRVVLEDRSLRIENNSSRIGHK